MPEKLTPPIPPFQKKIYNQIYHMVKNYTMFILLFCREAKN